MLFTLLKETGIFRSAKAILELRRCPFIILCYFINVCNISLYLVFMFLLVEVLNKYSLSFFYLFEHRNLQISY